MFICYLAIIGPNNQVVRHTPISLVAQLRLFRKSIERNPFLVNISHFNLLYKDRTSLHQARGARAKLHAVVSIIPISETHRNCENKRWNGLFQIQGSVEEKLASKMKNDYVHATNPKGQRSKQASPSFLPPLRASRSRMRPHRPVHCVFRRIGDHTERARVGED